MLINYGDTVGTGIWIRLSHVTLTFDLGLEYHKLIVIPNLVSL